MHEMGHIFLGHILPDTPALSRVGTVKRALFEVEAQEFARRVLCPSIVLYNCKAFEAEEIMELCGISFEAADAISEYLKNLKSHVLSITDPQGLEVEKQFEPFVCQYISRHFKVASTENLVCAELALQ